MKPQMFTNMFTGQTVICTDPRDIRTIDGIEYLVVTRPGDYQNRSFMIRKDSLRRIEKTIDKTKI